MTAVQKVGIISAAVEGAGNPDWQDYELQRIEAKFFETGVVGKAANALKVSQRGAGANMSIDVANGLGLVEITNTNIDSTTYKVWFELTGGPKNVVVTAADSTNPRIDIICLKVDVSVDPNSGSTNLGTIVCIAGTPAGSPAAPAVPANHYKLAQIAVAASVTSIVTANITDSRSEVAIKTTQLIDLARVTALDALKTEVYNDTPSWLGTVTGTNTLTATPTPAPAAYVTGQRYAFIVANTNSGAVTLNVNSLGAKDIKRIDGATALVASDLVAGQIAEVRYDGTKFQMTSPSGVFLGDFNKTLYAGYGASTTNTNPQSMTNFDTHNYTIPANDLIAGVVYRVRGTYTTAHGASGTDTIAIRLGNTTIVAPSYVWVTGSNIGYFEGFIMGTAAASGSATVHGGCSVGISDAGLCCQRGAGAAVATNGTLLLQIGASISSNNGGNSMILNSLVITKESTTRFT